MRGFLRTDLKDMTLQQILSSPCGIRFVADALDIQSSAARRMLMAREMMTDEDDILSYYRTLQVYINAVADKNKTVGLKNLQFRLQGLKDIRTTLLNLKESRVLDDIELYEVKHLALLAGEVSKQLQELGIDIKDAIRCNSAEENFCLDEVVRLLDPEGLHIATFYIYDAYSERLRDLRRQLEKEPENESVFNDIQAEEESIRHQLSVSLRPYADTLQRTLCQLGDMDIFLAQALQIRLWGLCVPEIVSPAATETESRYVEMWNPEVEEALKKKGNAYQRNSICFGKNPTLLTGSNMGGKTVVLKTVALCQYLTQFGFGLPALQARVAVKDDIRLCMTDGQSVQSGLSSFAAEMRSLDDILQTARTDTRLLALIDEPARTTNPVEGTALVSGLISVLKPANQSVLMVTHYTVNAHGCPCYRVSGLHNGTMDYSLVPTTADDVPHEALNIAEQLGVDAQWLEMTKKYLEK